MGKQIWSRPESRFKAALPLVGSAVALLLLLATARLEFVAWRGNQAGYSWPVLQE